MQTDTKKNVLILSGLDPTGGAGFIADCAAVRAADCSPLGVCTVLTVQDGRRFASAKGVSSEYLEAALPVLFDAARVDAVKIGALKSASVANPVARALAERRAVNVVIDPVMVSTSGGRLLDADGEAVLRGKLFPLATLVTPNLAEAAALADMPVHTVEEMKSAASYIRGLGPAAVLVKGGHLDGGDAVDVLLDDTGLQVLKSERKVRGEVRGTGCALSSLIAAWLARGLSIREAVDRSREMLGLALRSAYEMGGGVLHLGEF